MSTIPNRRAKKPPPLCPCGHLLVFRPWFTDCNGFVHYAATYGKKVFCWCPICDRGPFRRRSPVARKPQPPRRPPPSAEGAARPRVRKRRV
jgi:hypothetical protein